jgi:nitroimidazol reductase NimA-like FMN-containing flavoprotein (pyridoxamine 5'-phosphate oxidase superfamily)
MDVWTDVDQLDEQSCRGLLEASEVGRLALWHHGQPEIFPLNFVVRGDVLVFRTRAGTKLAAARGARVAFEIDGTDRVNRTGWSVVAKGQLDRIGPDDPGWRQVSTAHVDSWAGGERPHVLTMTLDAVSGRRVGWSD